MYTIIQWMWCLINPQPIPAALFRHWKKVKMIINWDVIITPPMIFQGIPLQWILTEMLTTLLSLWAVVTTEHFCWQFNNSSSQPILWYTATIITTLDTSTRKYCTYCAKVRSTFRVSLKLHASFWDYLYKIRRADFFYILRGF